MVPCQLMTSLPAIGKTCSFCRRNISETASVGNANSIRLLSTSNTRATERVNGTNKVKVVPTPGTVSTLTSPRTCLRLLRTTSIPTPRPDKVVTCSLVLNPGSKIRESSSSSVAWANRVASKPIAKARARILSKEMPRPSSLIVMMVRLP